MCKFSGLKTGLGATKNWHHLPEASMLMLGAGSSDLPPTSQPQPDTGYPINPFFTLSTGSWFWGTAACSTCCLTGRLNKCLAQWALACLAGDRESWPSELGLVLAWVLRTCVI